MQNSISQGLAYGGTHSTNSRSSTQKNLPGPNRSKKIASKVNDKGLMTPTL